ncbi:sensor domain-containing diguanylate cyclase [Geitlerinema sp. PCC 9228]|jgi:diguanylate cyclase (GGDEF)-like protein/PAS domain S-box-containing protein|uniref:sensor domain-containing diguanylate cyclase n=1 Tax=Geitlerinema sp. PCC 9228 TaxID=111611 RepID=UPI0008F9C75E|nr:sensor domain-containing diguanylate cyclase [Geitlerinema sp. PCC 9228]
MNRYPQYEQQFGLFDRIPNGVCVLRCDFVVLFWNQCLENWTQIPRYRIVGETIDRFFPHLKQPKYARRLQQVFAGGPPTVFSAQIHKYLIPVQLAGDRMQVQHTTVTGTPASEGSGTFHAIIAIQDVTDLTYQSQAYRQMRDQAQEEVRERQRAEAALKASEERFRRIFEEGPLGMALVSRNLQFLEVNATFCKMLGYKPAELKSMTLLALSHYSDLDALRRNCEQLFVGRKQTYKAEQKYLKKDGTILLTTFTAAVLHDVCSSEDRDGDEYGLVMLEDITERKQSEIALQKAHQELTHWAKRLEARNREITLLNAASDVLQSCADVEAAYDAIEQFLPVLFADTNGSVFALDASGSFVEKVVGWGEQQQSKTQFPREQCWGLQQSHAYLASYHNVNPYCAHIHADQPPAATLCVPLMAQGKTWGLLYLATQQPEKLNPAKQQLARAAAEQISLAVANLKLRDTLKQQSIRDPLTGLFNRRYLEESLKDKLHEANKSAAYLSVIMLDIDHFKGFNDRFGHDAGDFVLQQVGSLLQEVFRTSDVACRYGGEEFTLILPEASSSDSYRRAEELRQYMKQMQLRYGDRFLGPITVSLGVATYPLHGETYDELLQNADEALYQAKKQGRDRTVTYSDKNIPQ